jgi:DNA-binding LytR/AlgR family response regulator
MLDRILIIEDENPNANRLQRLINDLYPQATIFVVESVAESVEWLVMNIRPSVILMDIRLSDGLCFEIFEKVKINSPVIFTTAYDEYAIRAFRVNGVDYLLKPIEQDELKAAFDRIELQVEKYQQLPLDNLLQQIKPLEYRSRFLLPYKDGYKTVVVNDIAFFYSEHKLTKAMLNDRREEIIPLTLETLEKQLNPKFFFRANRQFIIHIDAIQNLYNHFNGKLKVDIKFNPGIDLIVSREKAVLLKEWLNF